MTWSVRGEIVICQAGLASTTSSCEADAISTGPALENKKTKETKKSEKREAETPPATLSSFRFLSFPSSMIDAVVTFVR